MKAICQLIVLVLLATLALTVLGVALFIGVGAMLSQWLPLSLFQASALAVGAVTAIALVIHVGTTMTHLRSDPMLEEDDFDWEPEQDDGSETLRTTPNAPKVGRNEPCPCGSGKKFKNCCGTLTPN